MDRERNALPSVEVSQFTKQHSYVSNIYRNRVQHLKSRTVQLLVVLVNEVKNQILSTSHALTVASLQYSLSPLTDLFACDC